MKNEAERSHGFKKPSTEYDEGFVEPYVIDVFEPKSWALDSPSEFTRKNVRRCIFVSGDEISTSPNIPLIENGSVYQSAYVIRPPSAPEAIMHFSEYDRRCDPLYATTVYQESYQREPFLIKRRVRPRGEINSELQQVPIVSTYQCDYQRHL
ncbi:hypothetical protein EG68_01683 [Paragonimus skrjabini miyazakii]|uniref:Uncharacterized protein n=1 Tax=Paragonimus skrjabini miyazakii TaxID=59628 RepID=A0A8S9Z6U4_9TREM|nr:hypothetical protein EG68_01683 [Paragonimus skrjabini miyazakii]